MDSHGVAHALDVEIGQIAEMAAELVEMLRHVHDAFAHLNPQPTDQVARLGRLVHQQERGLIERMAGRTSSGPIPGFPVDEDVIFVPMHLERIAENIERLGASVARMLREGTLFTDRAIREGGSLLQSAIEMLEGIRDGFRTRNRTLIGYVLEAGAACEAQANEFALFHEKRLIEGVCQPRASAVYLGMLDDIKGIVWHARQIAQKLQRRGTPADRRPDEHHG